MNIEFTLPLLLALAWLLPLASFALIVLFGPHMGRAGNKAAHVATTAIIASCVLSFTALDPVVVAAFPRADFRRLVRVRRVRFVAGDDRLLHRLAHRGHVLHGHAGGLVHPRLLDRLHARRAFRRDRRRRPVGRRPADAAARAVLPLLPVSFAVLLQHVGAGRRRQRGDGLHVLGTGRHLLLPLDRFLARAAKRQQRGQQGVHRQPRRRLRHDRRPDGHLDRHGHVLLRRLQGSPGRMGRR